MIEIESLFDTNFLIYNDYKYQMIIEIRQYLNVYI